MQTTLEISLAVYYKYTYNTLCPNDSILSIYPRERNEWGQTHTKPQTQTQKQNLAQKCA